MRTLPFSHVESEMLHPFPVRGVCTWFFLPGPRKILISVVKMWGDPDPRKTVIAKNGRFPCTGPFGRMYPLCIPTAPHFTRALWDITASHTVHSDQSIALVCQCTVLAYIYRARATREQNIENGDELVDRICLGWSPWW